MQVRQIVRVSDQGVSRPYQCYDEEGVLRWCKGNHTGLRSLLSEWVSLTPEIVKRVLLREDF